MRVQDAYKKEEEVKLAKTKLQRDQIQLKNDNEFNGES